jgi:enoyl-CoA hydratase/carnithine racemase
MAKRLILRGEVVDGEEAARLGIVHWSVPGIELASRARSLAAEITALPAQAVAACKRCIGAPLQGADGYEEEVSGTAALLATPETQQRVREFLEKRR